MKKIKLFLSIFTFTLLTVFVSPFLLSSVSAQKSLALSPSSGLPFGQLSALAKEFNQKIKAPPVKTPSVEEINKWKKLSLERERKRIAKEENDTLDAFSELTWLDRKKLHWLSPIMFGLKEITDKDGKTYKLDKIAQAFINARNKWSNIGKISLWGKNSRGSNWGINFLTSRFDFSVIRGEGRKQLLSLLEKRTGKPLEIITWNEKIIEYQEIFLNRIRDYLKKLQNSRSLNEWRNQFSENINPGLGSFFVVRFYGATQFWLRNLMKTENLRTVLYKDLDSLSKRQLLEITIMGNGFQGAERAVNEGFVRSFMHYAYTILTPLTAKTPYIILPSKPLTGQIKIAVSPVYIPLLNLSKKPNVLLTRNSKIQPIFSNNITNIKSQINKIGIKQEYLRALGKVKEKPESLLQTKIIKIQPKLTLTENFETKKLESSKEIKQIIKIQPETALVENLEPKKSKISKGSTLQTRRDKTKLIIALSVTSGVLTFSALSGCLYWFLKDKKITVSLPFLQNKG